MARQRTGLVHRGWLYLASVLACNLDLHSDVVNEEEVILDLPGNASHTKK